MFNICTNIQSPQSFRSCLQISKLLSQHPCCCAKPDGSLANKKSGQEKVTETAPNRGTKDTEVIRNLYREQDLNICIYIYIYIFLFAVENCLMKNFEICSIHQLLLG
jgi:hypothetical protein